MFIRSPPKRLKRGNSSLIVSLASAGLGVRVTLAGGFRTEIALTTPLTTEDADVTNLGTRLLFSGRKRF
jgi:hemolysin activation/secretion protein